MNDDESPEEFSVILEYLEFVESVEYDGDTRGEDVVDEMSKVVLGSLKKLSWETIKIGRIFLFGMLRSINKKNVYIEVLRINYHYYSLYYSFVGYQIPCIISSYMKRLSLIWIECVISIFLTRPNKIVIC